MIYIPKPIDTEKIELPRDLIPMMEEIAKNTHEIWAAARLDEGWRYGKVHDGKNKTHPCLVPYEQLPESEKEYDRNISIQMIKYILAKGFTISKEGTSI